MTDDLPKMFQSRGMPPHPSAPPPRHRQGRIAERSASAPPPLPHEEPKELDDFFEEQGEEGFDVHVQQVESPKQKPHTDAIRLRMLLGLSIDANDTMVFNAVLNLRTQAAKKAAVTKNLLDALTNSI